MRTSPVQGNFATDILEIVSTVEKNGAQRVKSRARLDDSLSLMAPFETTTRASKHELTRTLKGM